MPERFPATQAIARFVSGFAMGQAPALVVERGKELLLDLIGVTVAAAGDEVAHLVHHVAGPQAGNITLAGAGTTASAADAAFANGALAHCLEFDDSTLNPVGHPSCTILPALLALCEENGFSGNALLEAYLAGLEVHSRLGQAQTGNWSFGGGWLPIGHISLIGTAAACARLLRLNEGQTAHAIGLAAQFCGQLSVNSGTHAKPLGAGNSARTGMLAAQLALHGATAAPAIIEREGGFADAFFGNQGHDLAAPLSKLGAPHHLEEIGVAIKRYPSCYGCHWGMDALVLLMEEHKLDARQIKAVALAHPESGAFLDLADPRTSEEAKFSHEYNLAVTVTDGIPGVASFSPERIAKPDVQAVLKRVTTSNHPKDLQPPKAWEYRVTLSTHDGQEWQRAVPRPLGHPRRPMSRAELEDKFKRCTRPWLTDSDTQALIGLVGGIDKQRDLGAISSILRRVGRPPH